MKFALLVEYDGTDFAGWQVQPRIEKASKKNRSVQGEIERGFRQLFQTDVAVVGAGRTDSGVHGRGMVAHAVLPEGTSLTVPKLTIGLNATTPEDIAIRDVREVPDDFNARHSAL